MDVNAPWVRASVTRFGRTGNQTFANAGVNMMISHQSLVGMGSSGVKMTADVFAIRSQKYVHQIRYDHYAIYVSVAWATYVPGTIRHDDF